MAFADLGSLGATGSTNTNQTTLDLVTTAAVATGELVVVVVAADNIVNGGDDNACSGVTLGIAGQALTKGKQVANAVAAQGGASSSLWYGIASSGLASGGTIRATFGSATLVDASGMTARHFSLAGNNVAIEGTSGTLLHNTSADPGSLNVTTTNIECLRVRGIASQVGNNTNLTPTASWTAWANGNSATTGTTGEMCARAESRIFTGTGAASDPTYVSAINASVYVAFKELFPETADAWNANDKSATITLSSSDKTFTLASSATSGVRSTTKHASGTVGKFYIEVKVNTGFSGGNIGVKSAASVITASTSETISIESSGNIILNSSTIGNIPFGFSNDTICIAWDTGAERIWFRKDNGLWNNDAAANPATGINGLDVSASPNVDYSIWGFSDTSGHSATIRTELAEFAYSGPSGFTSWMGEALSVAAEPRRAPVNVSTAVNRAALH